ncbi:MAG: hypothetical protein CMP14_06275 [Rickettsiales bacterium]|nr:hypothetical protein [Rickettsiales bacterium]
MEITPLVPENRQIIQSYGIGRFRVSQIAYEGSIIVLPSKTLPWGVKALDDIDFQNLDPVLKEDPAIDILLIGCGKSMQLLPREFLERWRELGTAVDAMDTGAACRTYNILSAEGRRVAAAVIALD